MMNSKDLKVALVHDWLVAQRGGERVLMEMARLFPDAPIFTLVYDAEKVDPFFHQRNIITTYIQNLPGAPIRFRPYLPLFPWAAESIDLQDFDLVISTSHCVVKGVRTPNDAHHISYIHSPMRYAWDQMASYLPAGLAGKILYPFARCVTWPLRHWDRSSSDRPDTLLCNSHYVAQRIERFWRKQAQVLHPPVDIEFFAAASSQPRQGYVVVSSLVPYKGVDLAIDAANKLGVSLNIVGDGPLFEAYKKRAGPTVRFLGLVGREKLREVYARAEALWHCAVEDFGIVPIEASAAGCPVIALGCGGNLETVIPGINGAHFSEASIEALCGTVEDFRRLPEEYFSPDKCQAHTQQFSTEAFVQGLKTHVVQAGVS